MIMKLKIFTIIISQYIYIIFLTQTWIPTNNDSKDPILQEVCKNSVNREIEGKVSYITIIVNEYQSILI